MGERWCGRGSSEGDISREFPRRHGSISIRCEEARWSTARRAPSATGNRRDRRLVPVDEASFARWVAPRLRRGVAATADAFLRREPDTWLYFQDDQLRQIRPRAELEDYLRARILRGWAFSAAASGDGGSSN
ncbi:MAG: hypothetical protein M3Q65_03325 [Chloroflexota bacterium]|nr:hypothetical protein [Chloroflexota bacterium]